MSRKYDQKMRSINIRVHAKFQGLSFQCDSYTQKGGTKSPNAKRALVGAPKVRIRKRSRVLGPEGTPSTLHASISPAGWAGFCVGLLLFWRARCPAYFTREADPVVRHVFQALRIGTSTCVVEIPLVTRSLLPVA